MNLLNEFAARYRQGERRLTPKIASPLHYGRFASTTRRNDAVRWRRRKWPHLAHFWVEASQIAKCRVAFVPNRCVVRCADRSVVKWWDGSHGSGVAAGARTARRARTGLPLAGNTLDPCRAIAD